MSKASLNIKLERNEYPEYFEGKGKPKFDYPAINFSERENKRKRKFSSDNTENFSSNIQWINEKFKMSICQRPHAPTKRKRRPGIIDHFDPAMFRAFNVLDFFNIKLKDKKIVKADDK